MDKALSLVIEIQSDSVRGALVDFRGQAPEVICSASSRIMHKDHAGSEYITMSMLKSVENVAGKIMKEAGGSVRDAHFILSSPWVISKSKKVRIEYEEEAEITSDMIEEVVKEEAGRILEESSEDIVIVEQKIFDVSLNGYPVHSYEGKRALSLEVSLVLSMSSDEILKKMHSAVSRHIHFYNDCYHSALLLHYISLRSSSMDGDEFAVVHVHGELTDIVVVRNSFSSNLGSFPFGASTLVRKISSVMESSPETSSSMLSMHEEGRLEDEHGRRMEEALLSIVGGWHDDCAGMDIPRRVHLLSPNYPGIFKKILERSDCRVKIFDEPLEKIYIPALGSML
ncbi:MAG: hypothetical protein Q8Q03_02740 [bacterium]|nr:hypothetical protein [bacterium]